MGFSQQQAQNAIRQYNSVQQALDSLLAGVGKYNQILISDHSLQYSPTLTRTLLSKSVDHSEMGYLKILNSQLDFTIGWVILRIISQCYFIVNIITM